MVPKSSMRLPQNGAGTDQNAIQAEANAALPDGGGPASSRPTRHFSRRMSGDSVTRERARAANWAGVLEFRGPQQGLLRSSDKPQEATPCS